ncbi:hypothetical protein SmJEL517_g03859 [Synchytrium microbalum]|uniref:Integrase catalytic domain-containing protein n=1 Tax=Synchytrium microbalum TaxID=1806994 RepID=A0A507BWI8_9FUNG|nr:uncharacterized protein SmJEL517_g03859 [Synchytrium microbalum]TPX33197.1 hypothetical protein SmJEL517_g03859 [Synchytrium microbalum]
MSATEDPTKFLSKRTNIDKEIKVILACKEVTDAEALVGIICRILLVKQMVFDPYIHLREEANNNLQNPPNKNNFNNRDTRTSSNSNNRVARHCRKCWSNDHFFNECQSIVYLPFPGFMDDLNDRNIGSTNTRVCTRCGNLVINQFPGFVKVAVGLTASSSTLVYLHRLSTSAIRWLLDSGASTHMTGNIELLSDVVKPSARTVSGLGSSVFRSTAIGVLVGSANGFEWSIPNVFQNSTLPGVETDDEPCRPCIKPKIIRLPFPISVSPKPEALEVLHIDPMGPFRTKSLDGSVYILRIIEAGFHYGWVFPKKSRAETPNFKFFESDNAREFVVNTVSSHLLENGIIHRLTLPHAHQHNGMIERYNRTLQEAAKALLLGANLAPTFWAEAIKTACYLRNTLTTTALEKGTPFEALYEKEPVYDHLKVFGSKAFLHDPTESDKQQDRGIKPFVYSRNVNWLEDTKSDGKGDADVDCSTQLEIEEEDVSDGTVSESDDEVIIVDLGVGDTKRSRPGDATSDGGGAVSPRSTPRERTATPPSPSPQSPLSTVATLFSKSLKTLPIVTVMMVLSVILIENYRILLW